MNRNAVRHRLDWVSDMPRNMHELNAAEQLWKYTRKHATHNRFYETPKDLCNALYRTFGHMMKHRHEVQSLIGSFF